MTDKPSIADRRTITFAQAEGVEPLPQPLKLKEVSQGRAGANCSGYGASVVRL
jgi:hypothetical protein